MFSSVSWTGGPESSTPFQMPPPCATPAGPVALPTLPRHLDVVQVEQAVVEDPGALHGAEPVVLDAVAVLPLITLSSHRHELRIVVEVEHRQAAVHRRGARGLIAVDGLPTMRVLLIVPPPSSSSALPPGPTSAEVATCRSPGCR